MMTNFARHLLHAAILTLMCAVGSVTWAQTTPPPDLLAVDSAFVAGRYEETEVLALRLLQTRSDLKPDEVARLNLTAGYALIMLGREDDARRYFSRALDAVPDLTLDPVQVSPKFRVVFDEVKAAHVQALPLADTTATPSMIEQTVRIAHPSRTALISNLILPGSGQWQEGHRLRGAAVFAVQALTVGILVRRVEQMRDSRAEYLAETDPARIAEAYDRYNEDFRAAWTAGILAGIVYLGAQTDLILIRPKIGKEEAMLTLAFRW